MAGLGHGSGFALEPVQGGDGAQHYGDVEEELVSLNPHWGRAIAMGATVGAPAAGSHLHRLCNGNGGNPTEHVSISRVERLADEGPQRKEKSNERLVVRIVLAWERKMNVSWLAFVSEGSLWSFTPIFITDPYTIKVYQ